MQDGWFMVRNRGVLDPDDFDVKEAECRLFYQPQWDQISKERRGSSQLQKYLGGPLCAQIRGNFLRIQETIRRLLSDAEDSRKRLGDPRSNHKLRQHYIRDVIERYNNIATMALNSPGYLSDEKLRVRGLVQQANETFTADMLSRGHTYLFGDPNTDPFVQLNEAVSYYIALLAGQVPPASQQGESIQNHDINAPLKTLPRKESNAEKVPGTTLVQEIREKLRIWQTTQLPGLVSTDVIQVLYKKQSENWQQIAERHINGIADNIEVASTQILKDVCSPDSCSSILYTELSRVVASFQQQAKKKAMQEFKEHCRRERESHLQTTDSRFQDRLQALRTVWLLTTLGNIPRFPSGSIDIAHSKLLFQHFHHSNECNMVSDVHDVVKVYYEVSSIQSV